MVADHFTFLGHRDYELVHAGQRLRAARRARLRRRHSARDAAPARPPTTSRRCRRPPPTIIEGASPIFLTKANSRATVHRPGYLDYVGVKRAGADGKVIGERRFHRSLYVDRVSRADLRDSDRAAQVREHRAARGLSRERASGTSRSSRCSNSIRATNCSRPTKTSSSTSRSACCVCRSISARGCSCGATASTASCRASCSCRATSSTPICGSASRRC